MQIHTFQLYERFFKFQHHNIVCKLLWKRRLQTHHNRATEDGISQDGRTWKFLSHEV